MRDVAITSILFEGETSFSGRGALGPFLVENYFTKTLYIS